MNILIKADKNINPLGKISSSHKDIHETIKGYNWLCTITDIYSAVLIKHSSNFPTSLLVIYDTMYTKHQLIQKVKGHMYM